MKENNIQGDVCLDQNLNAEGISYGLYVMFCQNTFWEEFIYEEIEKVQQHFIDRFGSAIHAPTRKELHMTVMSLSNVPALQDTSQQISDLDLDLFFEKHVEEYAQKIKDCVSYLQEPSIECTFNVLGISNAGVYIKAETPQSITQVRNSWNDLPVPVGTRPPRGVSTSEWFLL